MTDQTETECLDIAAMTKLAQDFIAELKTLADARRGWNESIAASAARHALSYKVFDGLATASEEFIRANPEDSFMCNACDSFPQDYVDLKEMNARVEELQQNGASEADIRAAKSEYHSAWRNLYDFMYTLSILLGDYEPNDASVQGLRDAYRGYWAYAVKAWDTTVANANARGAVEATLKDFANVAKWLNDNPEDYSDSAREAHWKADNPLAARESAAH